MQTVFTKNNFDNILSTLTFDAICDAYYILLRIQIVYFPLCPNFKVDLHTPQP
jgi:hypothetical protein